MYHLVEGRLGYELGEYIYGMKTGEWLVYNLDGSLRLIRNYIDNKREGK